MATHHMAKGASHMQHTPKVRTSRIEALSTVLEHNYGGTYKMLRPHHSQGLSQLWNEGRVSSCAPCGLPPCASAPP